MVEQKTLRQVIAELELSPEDGGHGLEYYTPDDMFLQGCIDGDFLVFESADGMAMCGLLNCDHGSVLLGQDDINSMIDE